MNTCSILFSNVEHFKSNIKWNISWYITASYLIAFRIYLTTYELYFVFAYPYIFVLFQY